MATLDGYYEKELRKLATARNAEGYGRWLSAQKKEGGGGADAERQAAAGEAMRALTDYGVQGEALARTGLADDGYADYLRLAAKEARAARTQAIEDARASSERAALAGYADYLRSKKTEEGDRLVKAAEELLSLQRENVAEEDRIIETATADARAAALLRRIRNAYEYVPSATTRTDVPTVINRIRNMGYDLDRAYRYCRLVGYSDRRAREIADFATADKADLNAEISDLFGD